MEEVVITNIMEPVVIVSCRERKILRDYCFDRILKGYNACWNEISHFAHFRLRLISLSEKNIAEELVNYLGLPTIMTDFLMSDASDLNEKNEMLYVAYQNARVTDRICAQFDFEVIASC